MVLRPGSGSTAADRRRRHQQLVARLGRARGGLLALSGRWRLLALLLAGLMLHSLAAKRTQPFLAGTSGSLTGGIAIRRPGDAAAGGETAGEGGSARSRSLVEEQHTADVLRLGSLASAVEGLVKPWTGQTPPPPPPAPIPDAWVEGGTLGIWPKPYRNKTRQIIPNSIYEWRCGQEAANHSLAAVTHSPLLQSTEWRKRYGDDVTIFKWCRQGLPEEVPQLQQVLKLESVKPRPARGLTIVTQLSLERFQMLENQCSTWPLQISAVLYIPLLHGRIFSAEEPQWNKRSLDVGVAESLRFWRAMEASNSSCILDLEVVVEERCERYAAMLYPANAARNRALVNTKTEAMLLVDVDFAVSLSLAKIVEDEASYGRLMSMLHARNAVVLPAFETQDDGEAGRKVALDAVRQGKPYVVNKFQWNIVFGFHVPQYPQGHQATDYWRWIKSHAAYPVKYQIGYEPYIMMHRDYVPFYDERFRGYYWNKVQHLMHISLQNGFNFLVHPTAFVVHVPHKKPSTKWLTRKMGQKEKNHMLFDNALFHMRQQDFVPVTAYPELCRPEVAPPLPGEEDIRRIAKERAAAEKAAAEAAAAANLSLSQEAVEAAAAKRQAELEEAERWRAENAEAAAAAQMQHQDTAILLEQAQVAAAQGQLAEAAAARAAAAGADQGALLAAQQAAIRARQQAALRARQQAAARARARAQAAQQVAAAQQQAAAQPAEQQAQAQQEQAQAQPAEQQAQQVQQAQPAELQAQQVQPAQAQAQPAELQAQQAQQAQAQPADLQAQTQEAQPAQVQVQPAEQQAQQAQAQEVQPAQVQAQPAVQQAQAQPAEQQAQVQQPQQEQQQPQQPQEEPQQPPQELQQAFEGAAAQDHAQAGGAAAAASQFEQQPAGIAEQVQHEQQAHEQQPDVASAAAQEPQQQQAELQQAVQQQQAELQQAVQQQQAEQQQAVQQQQQQAEQQAVQQQEQQGEPQQQEPQPAAAASSAADNWWEPDRERAPVPPVDSSQAVSTTAAAAASMDQAAGGTNGEAAQVFAAAAGGLAQQVEAAAQASAAGQEGHTSATAQEAFVDGGFLEDGEAEGAGSSETVDGSRQQHGNIPAAGLQQLEQEAFAEAH